MKVLLKNIQSIAEAVFEFPDKGFVKISGGNSNGKSILVKTWGAITTLSMMDVEKRRALIRRGTDTGMITIEYHGRVLIVKLCEEESMCTVCLVREDDTKVIRTFKNGGISELLEEFGFRCYNKDRVCLQVYETFGPMPFVNRSKKSDGEVVEAVTEDHVAQEFLTKFKMITYKKAKETIKILNDKIEELTRIKGSLLIFEYPEYEAYAEKLEGLARRLETLDTIRLGEIVLPLSLDFVNIPEVRLQELQLPLNIRLVNINPLILSELPLPRDLPVIRELQDLSHHIEEINAVMAGVCPTCGKRLLDECTEEHQEIMTA